MGAGDPSTFLGYELCLRMIKYPRTIKKSMCTWAERPRKKEGTDMVTKVPKEQKHLENTLGNQPLWKDELLRK